MWGNRQKWTAAADRQGDILYFGPVDPKLNLAVENMPETANNISQKRENLKNVNIFSTNIPLSGAASILSGQPISGIIFFKMSSSRAEEMSSVSCYQ